MSQGKDVKTSDAELVANALNEQGYLLHYKVVSMLESSSARGAFDHDFHIDAVEVPVSIPNGDQTKIDIVLRPQASKSGIWRIVVECKRASRDFKRWIFFGNPSVQSFFVEAAQQSGNWNCQGDPPMMQHVERLPIAAGCPIFEYGVEARINRLGSNQRSSATDAIESAFQQVMLGQVGLSLKLREMHETHFRLFPVVVTTATLMSAAFDLEHVSVDLGTIDERDLTLEQRPWLAVNYHVNDVTNRHSKLTTNHNHDLALEIAGRQMRTVFVVQAPRLHEFLHWLEASFN